MEKQQPPLIGNAHPEDCAGYAAGISYLGGAYLSGKSYSVQAGQWVSLEGFVYCVNGGATNSPITWTVTNPSHMSEGFCTSDATITPSSGGPCTGGPAFVTTPTNYYQNYPYFAFYFLVPGQSETITLYGIDPLGSPQQASVSFTVDGPTNVTVAEGQTVNVPIVVTYGTTSAQASFALIGPQGCTGQ